MVGRVVVVVVFVASCKVTAKVYLDNEKAQEVITKWLGEREVIASVKCPDTELETGRVFECTAIEPHGAKFTVVATIKDDEGNVRFIQRGSMLQMPSVRTAVVSAMKLPGEVQVTCDKHVYLENETGRCLFTLGPRRGHVDLKATAADVANGEISMDVLGDD